MRSRRDDENHVLTRCDDKVTRRVESIIGKALAP